MSLVKSRELFRDSSFPVTVDQVVHRTLIQKELHRHEYFELLYVEKGKLINHFKDTEVVLNPGEVLILKPYVLHVLADADAEEERKAYCCSFLPQSIDSGIQNLEAVKISSSPNRYFFKSMLALTDEGISAIQLKIDEDRRDELSHLFEQLNEVTHEGSERGDALTRCHLLAVMDFLSSQYDRNSGINKTVEVDLAVPISRYQSGLRKALGFIHDNYDQSITLEQVSAMSGASETYFCRLFKHETGSTFLNYLNGLRIERACVLLRDSTDNALDICYEVGFNDYTHFSRQFKKHTGSSPASFRKEKLSNRRIRTAPSGRSA